MSRLPDKSWWIGLQPREITVSRGWFDSAGEPPETISVADSQAAAWHDSLTAFEKYVEHRALRRVDMSFALSGAFVRVIVVPWSGDVRSKSEWREWAALTFERTWGESFANWEIRLDRPRYQRSRLACAVDKDLLDRLHKMCQQHDLRIKAIRPYFTAACTQLENRIPDQSCLIVVPETTGVTLGAISSEQWLHVRWLPAPSRSALDLATWVERERRLLGLPEDAQNVIANVFQANHGFMQEGIHASS